MTQIFISYSRTERPVAARLAERLGEAGYDVWWDAELLGGQKFEDEILAALKASSAVVVLWSNASAASDWVRAEAEAARVAQRAVPVLIDDVALDKLPLVFRALHTIDLRKWNGDTAATGFRDVLGAVARLSGAPGPSRQPPPSHYPPPSAVSSPRKPRSLPLIAAAAVVLLAIAGALAWWQLRPAAPICASSELIALTEVPIIYCVGSAWKASADNSPEQLEYKSTDGQAIFRVVPTSTVVDMPTIRQQIVTTAQRIAGDASKIVVVRDGERTIGGKSWKFVEFTNAGVADFVDYYYSADGFGSAHIQIVGPIANMARRDELAAPVLDSIRFTR